MGDNTQTSADFERAVDKVRDEMASAKKNKDAIGAVGEIVTAMLNANPAAAPEILAEGKTLKGCYKAMEDYARKHKEGCCYCIPPEQAETVICKYFGIKARVNVLKMSADVIRSGDNVSKGEANGLKPKAADPFDLDALIGAL